VRRELQVVVRRRLEGKGLRTELEWRAVDCSAESGDRGGALFDKAVTYVRERTPAGLRRLELGRRGAESTAEAGRGLQGV